MNIADTEILTPVTKFVKLFGEKPFEPENGGSLPNIQAAYQTYGRLNRDKSNAVIICHALTGTAHAAGIVTEKELSNSKNFEFLYKYNKMYYEKPGWWAPLIGPGKVFDTEKYFIISSNILGGCYGTTGPNSVNPASGEKYNYSFPKITVRDMVVIQKALIDYLGVKRIAAISGGSLGGMQTLEWAAMFGEMVDSIIPVAASAEHSPWAIGWGEISRRAIQNDPDWENGNYSVQPFGGLSLARKTAMISYRTHGSFQNKFGREKQIPKNGAEKEVFSVESYLEYQGKKFVDRFDANSYLIINEAMDTMDLGRGRGSANKVLNSFKMPALCIGIDSDILYPASEQKEIAAQIPNSEYAEIKSPHGHDAFLIEFEQLANLIGKFLHNI